MATSVITLSNTVWTRITAAGQSGTCWAKTIGLNKESHIVIDHTTDETADTLTLDNENVTLEKSKYVPHDNGGGDDVLSIPADGASDIYYALIVDENPGKIAVDLL